MPCATQLPGIVGRTAQLHNPQVQVLAPFATSPTPDRSGEISSPEVFISTPTPISKEADISQNAAHTPDERRRLSTFTTKTLLLPRAEYPTAAMTPLSVTPVSATGGVSLGMLDGDANLAASGFATASTSMPSSGTPPARAQAESSTWSPPPHRVNRHPLKPLHAPAAAGATAGTTVAAAPIIPAPTLPLSSFSHKLRRRLQNAAEERGGSVNTQPKAGNATGSDMAAAAAAAIAATVCTSARAEDALKRAGLMQRCTPLSEGPCARSLPSTPHDIQDLGDHRNSAGTPGVALSRSTSLSPYGSSAGQTATKTPRPIAAPLLRRRSSISPSAQLGIAFRSEYERGSGGGGASSSKKAPAAPGLRLTSASPTYSSSNDFARFLQRSPSVCSISDADQEGPHFFTEDEIYPTIFRSLSGESDVASPSPLLTASPQATAVMPQVTGRAGKDKVIGVRAGSSGHVRGSRPCGGGRARQGENHQQTGSCVRASNVLEPPDVSLQSADTPKLHRQNSCFDRTPTTRQRPSSRRNSRLHETHKFCAWNIREQVAH